jgi:hypothetical protein
LDEQGFGTLLVRILNFYYFWNHDDVTWDCPKGKILGKRKGILKHTILGRIRRIVSTL